MMLLNSTLLNAGLTLADKATTISTIEVTDNVSIEDIKIQLNISHAREEDLDIFLVAADGTQVELFSDVDTGGGLIDMLLDDEATMDVTVASSGNGKIGVLNSWSMIVEHY